MYCNSVLASETKITDELQQVRNAAARRLITKKYERGLSRLSYDDLHLLTIPQRVHAVQACCDCSSVSSTSSFKVPRKLLRASLRSFPPPTSPFGQPSQTEYLPVSSQYVWHLGFLSRRSEGLELTACFVV